MDESGPGRATPRATRPRPPSRRWHPTAAAADRWPARPVRLRRRNWPPAEPPDPTLPPPRPGPAARPVPQPPRRR
ncbi:MAG: hypothetical protein CVV18_08485 [Gammaproteobacteria bacterium HGW-Gammaproteobacteria-8]|nr:MAG: hypothetical protein CVV18_08485 [Gammaproteobacteria bacterium HGW-Gammaproteobacteria-8]